MIDAVDQQLLTSIQNNFPVDPRPYRVLGEQLGISEEETLERLSKLKEAGIIRRIGGIFDSRKLGYKSTLCSMEVPEERIEEVVAVVNQYIGVTHNYLRPHRYNVWFTLITPSKEVLEGILDEIKEKTGIPVNNLPATRLFKIKVNFQVPGQGGEKHAK